MILPLEEIETSSPLTMVHLRVF